MLTVYPRACGGTPAGSQTLSHLGLSPRVRGNPTRLLQGQVISPRVRGNHVLSKATTSAEGLSPRVRGNPSKA